MNEKEQIAVAIEGLEIVRKDIEALVNGAEFDVKSYSAMLEIMDESLDFLGIINRKQK